MATAAQSYSRSASTSYDTGNRRTATTSRPYTGRSRPRTGATSTGYSDNEIICAITESRGVSPAIGLSFVNLTTTEAVLCQFADTQTYARTCHKIKVLKPSEIIFMNTAEESKLLSIIRENLDIERDDIVLTKIDRRYWSDAVGFEYVQHLAIPDDLESLKLIIGGNYFATCCFGAVMKYIELGMGMSFAAQTLRIRYEPSEGSMLIDLSTIASLELIQNLQDAKSKDCLFGLLNETLTNMGGRILRSNVLQPSTDKAKILERYEVLEELVTREEMFYGVRTALTDFVDTDRCLSALVQLPTKLDFQYMEQSVNNVLMLKSFLDYIKPVWQALGGATSQKLQEIHQLCDPENYAEVEALVRYALNDDVSYAKQTAELRNQRVYAIRAGVNNFLDVARQTYKEVNDDVNTHADDLKENHDVNLEVKFDPARQHYLRILATEFEERPIADVFVNVYRRKGVIECQTLYLMKLNQKIKDAHNEVISMSDHSVQSLIDAVRSKIHRLFKISESIALLDMLAGFAQVVTMLDYTKPDITATLALKAMRHPIQEKIRRDKIVPNDVYATQQNRFQIITGANMSGKSTYIRSVALNALIAQIGCFTPCQYSSFPLFHQLFARISVDNNVESNVSTFASEMREMAFILRNIEPRSLVIIDELGRGTSTTDGLAIAVAIAEALIESKAYVWFVTHFRDLPRILNERAGVVNLHLSTNIAADMSKITTTYRISEGPEETANYGLALAKTMALPEGVLDVATQVSDALRERNEARKSNPRALAVARRRKLVLNLREQLVQANESKMEDKEALREWLKRLQDEFMVRMSAIEAEAGVAEEEDGTADGVSNRSESIHRRAESSAVAISVKGEEER